MPQNESSTLQSDFQFLERLRDAERQAEEIRAEAEKTAEQTILEARASVTDILQTVRTEATEFRAARLQEAEQEAQHISDNEKRKADEEAGRIRRMADGREVEIIDAVAERIMEKHAHC